MCVGMFQLTHWQTLKCIRWISHNTPFCNRNIHMCGSFCYKIEHYGIYATGLDWCIIGFIQQVYGNGDWRLLGMTFARWHHELETFSVLLALCEGHPPVTAGFPSQRPVTRGFNVFFDLRLDRRLSKQSRRRGFEMPLRSWWRHCTDSNISLYNFTKLTLIPQHQQNFHRIWEMIWYFCYDTYCV